MEPTRESDRPATLIIAALLIASGAVFTTGVAPQPSRVVDLYEIDDTTGKYAVIAAHAEAYRWGNLAAGVAALVALYAIWRLARRSGRLPGVERVALAGLAAATLGWLVAVGIRASVVVDAASTGDATALSDSALTGTGIFLAASLVYCASLIALAVRWARSGKVPQLAGIILVLTSLASALLVRSDPVAVAFLPPFTFWVGLPAIGIALLWQTRRHERRGLAGAPASSSQRSSTLDVT